MGKTKRAPFGGQQITFNTSTATNFPTFFIIKRSLDTNETFHSVSPFLVEKAITSTVGEVKSTKKLRCGDLLVEVCSRKQSQQIVKMKALSNIPVTVSPHASLNSSKGVISCGELFNVPIEEITKELQIQGVSHVRRISIRRDGQLLNTKHLILTFTSSKLPDHIKAGYMRLAVRPYVPNPLRCFKCQRFGHSKSSGRGTLTCARCAEVGHDSTDCIAQEKCVNCKGEHTSFSRNCFAWKQEKGIISTKVKNQISYQEARKLIKSKTSTAGKDYASVVKKLSTISTQWDLNDLNSGINLKQSDSAQSNPVHSNNLLIPSPRSVPPVCEVVSASPDLTDFKLVTHTKKTSPREVSQSMPVANFSSSTVKSKLYDKMDEANSVTETMSTDKSNQNTDSEIESDNAIIYNPHETIDETPPAPELSTDSTTVDKTVFKQSLQKRDMTHFALLNIANILGQAFAQVSSIDSYSPAFLLREAQGSVLSVTLFIVHLSQILNHLPQSVHGSLHFDDLQISCQGFNPMTSACSQILNNLPSSVQGTLVKDNSVVTLNSF
ncbi:uncharacterized protein LOC129962838 [Argiope bruennichi]|uniref:uncharacterized protein LOC129962838 n=1 Tax=Argiope bruennichi TaxID=94029 RepID=UPI002494C71A|nr:uncharacterized protein LOC129962838 [Argiope bruennichi]